MKLRTGAPRWFNEDDPSKEAKCIKFPASRDRDPWYGDSDDPDAIDDTAEAKKICQGTDDNRPCPLLAACLEFAMNNNERYGVWGGLSPDERAELRKERRSSQRSVKVGAKSLVDA